MMQDGKWPFRVENGVWLLEPRWCFRGVDEHVASRVSLGRRKDGMVGLNQACAGWIDRVAVAVGKQCQDSNSSFSDCLCLCLCQSV
jgi:hypothetical protein